MVIDWGFVTLNHWIPQAMIENPGLSAAEVVELVEVMRPAIPEPVEIPAALAAMVRPVVIAPEELERAWRDGVMAPLLESRDRHRDELELKIATTLTDAQFGELLAYIQALRDWPQAPEFPDQVHRPIAPAWLDN